MDGQIHRDAVGRLVLRLAGGAEHVGVVPVQPFPLSAPGEGVSLQGVDGRELAWIERLDGLPGEARALLEQELAVREFRPELRRLLQVSSFATPSRWQVETDRGGTAFTLRSEEDIRRLSGGALLIASAEGVLYRVRDRAALDRHSRRLLERFL